MSTDHLQVQTQGQIDEVQDYLEEDSFHEKLKNEKETSHHNLDHIQLQPSSVISNSSQTAIQNNNSHTRSQSFQKLQSSQLQNYSQVSDRIDNQQSRVYTEISAWTQQEQSTLLEEYFQNCKNKVKSTHAIEMTQQVKNKIRHQIKYGKIQLATNSRNVSFQKKQHSEESTLKQLQKDRQLALKKLRQIEDDEQNILIRHKSQSLRQIEKKRSEFTRQDQEMMSRLLKEQSIHEQSLQRKKQKMFEKITNQTKAEEQRKLSNLKDDNLRKKEKIKQKLKQIQTNSEQRKEMLKNSLVREDVVYYHQKAERARKQQQKKLEDEKLSKLKEIISRNQLKIDDIKEHERRYSQLLDQNQVKRKQSSVTHSTALSQKIKKKKKTVFDKIVEEELKQIKLRQLQKLTKVKEISYKDKINKYQVEIDEKHKPKLASPKTNNTMPKSHSHSALTKDERVQIGLDYLEKAKHLRKRAESHRGSQLIQPPKKIELKNYMKELLIREEKKLVDPIKSEFEKITYQENITDYNSALRAKHLAEGLDAKLKKLDDGKIFYSMKNKLKLLNGLY